MYKKGVLSFLILTVLMLSFSCKQEQKEERIVTVTIEPQRYFAEKIAGDKFKINTMVPVGSSPESFDPSPASMVKLNDSKAYFMIGKIGFENTWMDKLKKNYPDMKVYDNSKNIYMLEAEEHVCDGNHDHHHGEENFDPHTWSSPANAIVIAGNMLDAFVELDPENKEYYQNNFNILMNEIIATSDSVDSLLKDKKGTTFVIYHPSLTYLAEEYGLNQMAIEENGKEPSAATLKNLIDKVSDSGAKVIFVQQEFDEKNAATIAKELGLKIVKINPLNYNWKEETINIAKAISDNN